MAAAPSSGAATRLSRDLLVRAIAYKMQEKAQSGLSQATKRKLRTLEQELEAKGHAGFDPGLSLGLLGLVAKSPPFAK